MEEHHCIGAISRRQGPKTGWHSIFLMMLHSLDLWSINRAADKIFSWFIIFSLWISWFFFTLLGLQDGSLNIHYKQFHCLLVKVFVVIFIVSLVIFVCIWGLWWKVMLILAKSDQVVGCVCFPVCLVYDLTLFLLFSIFSCNRFLDILYHKIRLCVCVSPQQAPKLCVLWWWNFYTWLNGSRIRSATEFHFQNKLSKGLLEQNRN